MRVILKSIGSAWMAFAHILGRINTVIILTICYWVILLPFGIIARMGALLRGTSAPAWIEREQEHPTLETLRRPF